jgi:hypothetical protein
MQTEAEMLLQALEEAKESTGAFTAQRISSAKEKQDWDKANNDIYAAQVKDSFCILHFYAVTNDVL